ncbi:hypothetical protein [Arthrobacter sp. SW1]|uniref:hypothetical protein n=1 Tax=Arthrobacter sp. SW1 TaxID=1920889 RepID=UPI001113061D|nr:hypothetical protein [Arthrobacter sp. SW1]
MASYSALEKASSKHPHDWGRAVATAMTRLVEAARLDGRTFENEFLFGEELQLCIEEDENGATIRLSWAPAD